MSPNEVFVPSSLVQPMRDIVDVNSVAQTSVRRNFTVVTLNSVAGSRPARSELLEPSNNVAQLMIAKWLGDPACHVEAQCCTVSQDCRHAGMG